MVFQVRALEDGDALRMIDLMERKIIERAQRPQEGWRCWWGFLGRQKVEPKLLAGSLCRRHENDRRY